jgi:purine-nucleoside phosphorylase
LRYHSAWRSTFKKAGPRVNHLEAVSSTVHLLREKLGNIQAGTLGLVLGSGLTPVAEAVEGAVDIPYAELPGLPQSTVAGHGGFLRAGRLAGRPVLAQIGRASCRERVS